MEKFEIAIAEVRGKFESDGCQLYFRLTTYKQTGSKMSEKVLSEPEKIEGEFYEYILLVNEPERTEETVTEDGFEEFPNDWRSGVRHRKSLKSRRIKREREDSEELDISSSDLTGALGPYLSILGQEGWDIVDYKVSTMGVPFAQALLRRKKE